MNDFCEEKLFTQKYLHVKIRPLVIKCSISSMAYKANVHFCYAKTTRCFFSQLNIIININIIFWNLFFERFDEFCSMFTTHSSLCNPTVFDVDNRLKPE